MTDQRKVMLDFWQHQVLLPFEETLPLGGGRQQLRHGMNGSVLKINHSKTPIERRPASGYRGLWIADEDIRRERALRDPDGNGLVLLPRGERGVEGIGVSLGVRDPDAFHRFYADTLGLERCGDDAYRCGTSLLHFAYADDAPSDSSMEGRGYRYITIQVHDVDREHAGILARGGAEGQPPRTLGKVARISFVRDPDGNWIEISQRASLTGPLPD
jgi:lactoylglutathione lyase